MKTSKILWAMIALTPAAALAAGAFDGTWKVDMSRVHLSSKPYVYVITNNSYACSSCKPAYTVKADGKDQPVSGHDFDTVAVTVTPTTVTVVQKIKGKPFSSLKSTVSADGTTVAQEGTYYNGAQPVQVKSSLIRVGAAPPGVSALSGSWRDSKVESVSDAGITETLGITDTGFTMSSNGQSYDAKFDGKKYPVQGDATNTMVTLKKISPTEVVESDYDKRKLVEIVHMTVAKDGKTLHIVDQQLQSGRVIRYTAIKQP